MYISAISSNNVAPKQLNKQKSFKGLIKDRSIYPILNSMSQKDIAEFKQIEERLSKTKFWDMKISSLGNKFNEFRFDFIDKMSQFGVISNGIYPYNKENNTIKVYSIVYGPENISRNVISTLRYKSKERADEVYENYIQNMEHVRYRGFHLTPLESLKSKEIELNMLEEAAYCSEETDKSDWINTEIDTKSFIGNNFSYESK